MTATPRIAVVVFIAALLAACGTHREQLARGQQAFERNDYDRTLAILRDLERDRSRLTQAEQGTYAYLRGMSDYRVGHRANARYWLSIARTYEESVPGTLPADWTARMHEALEELQTLVREQGWKALTTTHHRNVLKPTRR